MRALAKISGFAVALTAVASNATETNTHKYDARGRLVQVVHSGSVNNGINSCYAFDQTDNRANATVANSNCAVVPPASFSVGDASSGEGSSLVFTVTKTGSPAGSLDVSYATTNGTAVAGSDYTSTSGTLTFGSSEFTKTITVPSTDDVAVEGAEDLFVNLSGATGGATVSDYHAVGAITDNDAPPPPSFSINDVSGTEGGTLTFTVTKTGSTPNTILIYYSTANGTAFAGTDFLFTDTSVTLTFAPAETTKTIIITTIDNAAVESSEIMYVNLSGGIGGTISDAQGVGTIIDND